MALEKITKILLSIIVIIALAESFLRFYDFIFGKTVNNIKNNISYFTDYKNHPYLVYTSRKNQSGYQIHLEPGKYFKTTTNSDGFRSREFYPRVNSENLRVMILGDSFIWGYNVNDNETLGYKLEKKLKERLNKDVEVYSLGVPSYSTIIYQGIARTYFDTLKPDIVIVAIDQNDFEDDLIRKKLFKKDENGHPLYYADYKKDNNLTRLDGTNRNLKSEIKLTSILVEKINILIHKIVDPVIHKIKIKRLSSNYEILKYKDIDDGKKENLYKFYSLHRDNICCNLETSKKKYNTSFQSLKFVKQMTDKIGAELYFTTYPYAWYIDPEQSLEWQLKLYKGEYILDFRGNTVYTDLVDFYAEQLSIKNFNFYEYVKSNPGKYWGDYDPHFNALGYDKFSEFLTENITNNLKSQN